MSIAINFEGTVSHWAQFLEQVKQEALEHQYGLRTWESGCILTLCPLGEVRIDGALERKFPEKWTIRGSCVTTPAGPGFHKAASSLIRRLSQVKGVQWKVEDETGFYDHEDFQRMRKEHFLPWMKAIVKMCGDRDDYESLCICWNLDGYIPVTEKDQVTTCMGPLYGDEPACFSTEKGLEELAQQFFLWGNEEKDGLYYRNCALNRLWESCYFAPSLRSDEDRQINGQILRNLEEALRLDPKLPFPKEAYQTLCHLDQHQPKDISHVPDLETRGLIGYRRGDVRERFGDLTLILPGRYQYELETLESGNTTNLWTDTSDEHCPVWRVNGYRREGGAHFVDRLFDRCVQVDTFPAGAGQCRAGVEEQREGDPYYHIMAQTIGGEQLSILTVTYDFPEQEEEIFRRLRAMKVAKPQEPELIRRSYGEEE